jgi:hypothetical protein
MPPRFQRRIRRLVRPAANSWKRGKTYAKPRFRRAYKSGVAYAKKHKKKLIVTAATIAAAAAMYQVSPAVAEAMLLREAEKYAIDMEDLPRVSRPVHGNTGYVSKGGKSFNFNDVYESKSRAERYRSHNF